MKSVVAYIQKFRQILTERYENWFPRDECSLRKCTALLCHRQVSIHFFCALLFLPSHQDLSMCGMIYVCDMTHACVTWLMYGWHFFVFCSSCHHIKELTIFVVEKFADSYVAHFLQMCSKVSSHFPNHENKFLCIYVYMIWIQHMSIQYIVYGTWVYNMLYTIYCILMCCIHIMYTYIHRTFAKTYLRFRKRILVYICIHDMNTAHECTIYSCENVHFAAESWDDVFKCQRHWERRVERGTHDRDKTCRSKTPLVCLMEYHKLCCTSSAAWRSRPIATHCNTLQHTATHCNTLQHTATSRAAWRPRRLVQHNL